MTPTLFMISIIECFSIIGDTFMTLFDYYATYGRNTDYSSNNYTRHAIIIQDIIMTLLDSLSFRDRFVTW